ncbi:MAG: SOS response-associated peptidase [Fimbriimonadaceae bacterium]|nr:SOS response-associated peptidase [Fimbriimonadaceae bacterium]
MCARFGLKVSPEQLETLFGLAPEFDPPQDSDFRPTHSVLVLTGTQESVRWRQMRWGLIPAWANSPDLGVTLINARSETVTERPAFRHLIGRRRCVIPVSQYYEWHDEVADRQMNLFGEVVAMGRPVKVKQAFALRMDITPIAGLWDRWRAPDGSERESCTILTTRPNALTGQYHDRMPAVLHPDTVPVWLDRATSEEYARQLLEPVDSGLMHAWRADEDTR